MVSRRLSGVLAAALLICLLAACGRPTPLAGATSSPTEGAAATPTEAVTVVADDQEPTATPSTGEAEVGEMPDGFVKMPGEPSRQDPRYVITEDVCGQFTARFVSGLLGRAVDRVESSSNDDSYTCTYYLEPASDSGPGPYVSLMLRYASVENQEKGHTVLAAR
jgi:hypothetical protein